MNGNWTADKIPVLKGNIAIITGANSGIGYEAAREFARNGAEVIFASRSQAKAEAAMIQIKEEFPDVQLVFIQLDLANLQSVRNFAEEFNSRYNRLDILLNNAGIMLVPYGTTEDGFENTLGINHLGHFALTGLLIEKLTNTPGARIVNISSNAHYGGELDFSNFMYENGKGYTPMGAYSRSKLSNLLFTYELQRRFEINKLDALALAAHPGISATGLADHFLNQRMIWFIRSVMRMMFQSSAMGSLPGIRAAVDQEAKGGQYYGPAGKGEKSGYPIVVDSNEISKNLEYAQKLWEISQELTGVRYLD